MAGFEKMFVGGTDNKAKEIKSIFVGVNNKAKTVAKIYWGDANNKAQLIYNADITPAQEMITLIVYGVYDTSAQRIVIEDSNGNIALDTSIATPIQGTYDTCYQVSLALGSTGYLTYYDTYMSDYSHVDLECIYYETEPGDGYMEWAYGYGYEDYSVKIDFYVGTNLKEINIATF